MDLIKNDKVIDKSLDTVIVQKVVTEISGGVVLDVEGYDGEYIYAGQPIVVEDVEGKANYKPLNVTKEPVGDEKGTLEALGEGQKLLGLSIQSTSVDKAQVGVVTFGVINNEASYFDISVYIKELGCKEPIK